MAKTKLTKQFPAETHGAIVISLPTNPEASSWDMATRFIVRHIVDTAKASYTLCETRDDAIVSGRKLALSFNVQLFIEEDGRYVELPVDPEGEVDKSLLSKVRKLIAKAESTDVAAERDAFLTKAQEWMVRHAIDESLVKADAPNPMTERKVVVGSKGAGVWAKRLLVNSVASYAGLRSWSVTHSYYSVIAGYREDVEYAEMLITSLLLQLEQEYTLAFKNDKPEWTDARTFRANFMEAFTDRVGSRLSVMKREAQAQAADAAREAADAAGTLLSDQEASQSVSLVLRNRKAKVSEWVDGNHKFVNTQRSRAAYCGSATQAGNRAGSRADLSGGRTGKLANRKMVTA
jgi:hypothetical protein